MTKKPHQPAPTMQTIAARLGVSRMTVSFALNGNGRLSEEMRQKVLDVARELDFKPNQDAQRLKGQRSNNVNLFVLCLDSGVGSSKIRSIQDLLRLCGHDLPVHCAGLPDATSEASQVAVLAALRRDKSRAIIVATSDLHPRAIEELQHYQDEGGLLVAYDHPTILECDHVLFDREENTYQATRYLLEMGHRDVGIGFHYRLQAGDMRYQGYRRALHEFGVEPCAEWELDSLRAEDYAAVGVAMAQQFLALSRRPTAMAIINDYAAMAFLSELRVAGVECPRDLSLVGHDDHPLSRHYGVPLSTVTHPTQQIAEAVVEHLLSRLNGYDGLPRIVTLRGQLVPRESAIPNAR